GDSFVFLYKHIIRWLTSRGCWRASATSSCDARRPSGTFGLPLSLAVLALRTPARGRLHDALRSVYGPPPHGTGMNHASLWPYPFVVRRRQTVHKRLAVPAQVVVQHGYETRRERGCLMLVTRAYKTELALSDQQVTACRKHAGAARWAYN